MTNANWAKETHADGFVLETMLTEDVRQPGCLVQIQPVGVRTGLHDLTDDETVLGRDADCSYQLPCDSASRCHAVIRPTGIGYSITDLDSTNGTYVNDVRVKSRELRAGDHIRIGSNILKFLSAGDIEAQYHETVYSMMTRDALTDTYNSRYLIDALERELARTRRHGRPLALIFVDVDHFKRVNDNFGHLVGDEVLQKLCQRCGSVLRQDNILARYGGEEFAVVLSEATLKDSRRVAERLKKAIASKSFETAAGRIAVTISLGIAQTNGEHDWSAADLIREADEMLYAAKESGRNCVRFRTHSEPPDYEKMSEL